MNACLCGTYLRIVASQGLTAGLGATLNIGIFAVDLKLSLYQIKYTFASESSFVSRLPIASVAHLCIPGPTIRLHSK